MMIRLERSNVRHEDIISPSRRGDQMRGIVVHTAGYWIRSGS